MKKNRATGHSGEEPFHGPSRDGRLRSFKAGRVMRMGAG